ncbi:MULTISPECIES: invasion regulator SirB1 [Rahnella]|jgi:regulator of sirC expression with transglutaminase-like and TPR domain|uniref:invasion regulator SirB1 n=1 Tax=Rahnella TaxID=34037 RepID=UPI00126602C0|nr:MULTISPECIES: invasion regulator SirB1 [Rahnella]KAB8309268.1 tetratricopeptide repeat-containing protein [Rouxiella chamberiensis]MBU9820266.1 tetratricopeptide repeat-containing protein [Rahnella sp. BCC 1045]MCS3422758.1 regulator of sirC expression with transglutaminase-like and TPR domain [Rahnella sp. BIGb0603]MDF1894188.1 invasion regulator SirB1 [Rahnella contaminans]
MSTLADFEFNTTRLSTGVIKVTESVRFDFNADDVRQQLQTLVDEARRVVPEDLDQDQQLEVLIELFYRTWGFGGAGGVYRLSDAIWIDKVLASRQGTPVSLGVIFLHIAHELDLPLMPVIFPTQLILRADWMDEEMWLLNPINGDTLNEHMLNVWLKGNLGVTAIIEDDDLEEADNTMIVRKMLDTLKAALMEEKQFELALRASETVLQFDPDDPYEIRDRGLIYAQLECDHVAISDLSYFVEQCPEDPISEVIKVQIHSIEHKQVTLH